MSIKKGRKLLDEIREVMRLRYYSIHTDIIALGTGSGKTAGRYLQKIGR